jgi:hypothetical protein
MLERSGCTSALKISVLTGKAKGLSHRMKGAALAQTCARGSEIVMG